MHKACGHPCKVVADERCCGGASSRALTGQPVAPQLVDSADETHEAEAGADQPHAELVVRQKHRGEEREYRRNEKGKDREERVLPVQSIDDNGIAGPHRSKRRTRANEQQSTQRDLTRVDSGHGCGVSTP